MKLREVLNRRMIVCAFTGFASGLPLFVLLQLVQAWLRDEGVGLTEIGLFALAQLPYTWKFIWSPIAERYPLPFLGRRRGWMAVTQVVLVFCFAAFGWFDPSLNLTVVFGLALLVGFFSASQDIVIDAYRRELLPTDEELALGNSIHVQAYRIAGFISRLPGTHSRRLSTLECRLLDHGRVHDGRPDYHSGDPGGTAGSGHTPKR